MNDLPPLWPHQARGLAEVDQLIEEGWHRIVVTSPTGGGKTRMMLELIKKGLPTLLLTNRTMLLEQTANSLTNAGIRFGVRAAGYKPALLEDIQLSSIQTEWERVYKQRKWDRHPARFVIVDERHNQKGEMCDALMTDYALDGAVQVGFTATPLDLDGLADALVVAGTNSELRDTGALLWAHTYAPDEPSAKAIKVGADGTFTEPSVRKAIMAGPEGCPAIFGRVIEHWRRLNPEMKPAIGFAPGVKESLWFAQHCCMEGIPAAHIDGSDIWINGEWFNANQENRDYLKQCSEDGTVKIVWNRYVMREGIDWTHLYHGIFATVFRSLSAYLQSGGRLLRAHPGMDHVVIQDHGGNWWRHGSLNENREWSLKLSTRIAVQLRERRLREKQQAEPICCPRCNAVRLWGRECPQCGYCHRTRPRMVIQSDGTLKEVEEAIHKPRRLTKKAHHKETWRRVYYRAKNADLTFSQATALFAKENNWHWPPEDFPLMPTRELDWFRRVGEVDVSALTGDPNANRDEAGRIDGEACESGDAFDL